MRHEGGLSRCSRQLAFKLRMVTVTLPRTCILIDRLAYSAPDPRHAATPARGRSTPPTATRSWRNLRRDAVTGVTPRRSNEECGRAALGTVEAGDRAA